MSTRRFRTTAPVLPYRESRSQRESRAQLVHSGPRQNLIVLYLVPIVLLAAMACWRISAAVTAQHPSAPRGSYALMIPRSDASTREAGANRSLRIASARRSNLGDLPFRS